MRVFEFERYFYYSYAYPRAARLGAFGVFFEVKSA